MRGLTIVVAGSDPERFRAALKLAAAQAALGGAARLFLDEAAVPLPAPAGGAAADELVAMALELGVAISLCQTGLAAAGLDLDTLDPRIGAAGLTSLLAELGEDRLVLA